ncbi:MAG: coenzyme F420-0:L-glutamate ligase [Chloroflexota bacterium]
MTARVELTALDGIGEVQPGDDLVAIIVEALRGGDIGLREDDVLVVTQKIVSKAEGRVVDLATVEPSEVARDWAKRWGKDARQVEVVLRESESIVRMAPGGLIISRTRHGLVCANAGVDQSNVPGVDHVTLLPEDPDRSARTLRDGLGAAFGVAPGIIISDSFGRPWRMGIVNVAIGAAGIEPLADLRGDLDAEGRPMRATIIAVADQIASAADLAGGKVARRPVVLVRGLSVVASDAGATPLVMPRELDLFP